MHFQNLMQIQNHQQSLLEEVEKEDMRRLLSTLTEGFKSQLDPNFFQDDNDVQYIYIYIYIYSNTNVKTRNLLQKTQARRCRKYKLCYQCFFVFNTEFKSNWS